MKQGHLRNMWGTVSQSKTDRKANVGLTDRQSDGSTDRHSNP